ncbi:C39 family peptidase [Miniphocaeibacter halophilus]|uniref:C39 family peptidase n=1 Tax=Miniphocaeibacter halophilus TaxID=2931922 RepID=A0AC61MU81_9FIRM|nr:C39 family peptidase [Miniphocaeibacter halophilus]QQK08175.1 C39 family peptidase [Miniphocaeibacter halophilus]
MSRKKLSGKAYKKRKRQIMRNRLFLIIIIIVIVVLAVNIFSLGNGDDSDNRFTRLIGTSEYDREDDEKNKRNNNIDVEYSEATDEKGWKANIEKAKKVNENASVILENIDRIPEDLLKMAGTNPQTIDFVAKFADTSIKYKLNYPNKIYKDVDYPYYIQWDQRWGYKEYGSGVIGSAGCAPTSLAMMLSGLLGYNITPDEIADIAINNGHVGDYGTGWDIYPFIAREYNLDIKELEIDKEALLTELDKGNPVIISVGPGTFTTVSHVMLIVGNDDNNNLKIYDPNNLGNSEKTWDFDSFKEEVKKMWAFSE